MIVVINVDGYKETTRPAHHLIEEKILIFINNEHDKKITCSSCNWQKILIIIISDKKTCSSYSAATDAQRWPAPSCSELFPLGR